MESQRKQKTHQLTNQEQTEEQSLRDDHVDRPLNNCKN